MKVEYDAQTDTLVIVLNSGVVAESDEPKPGTVIDYDVAGNIVSIEILDASGKVENPSTVDLRAAG